MNNSTNTIFKTMPVVLSLSMMTPMVANVDSFNYVKSLYTQVEPNYENLTFTIEKINIENKSNYEQAIELFDGKMRDFTKEESLAYEKSLDNLYKPVGVNIFDLC